MKSTGGAPGAAIWDNHRMVSSPTSSTPSSDMPRVATEMPLATADAVVGLEQALIDALAEGLPEEGQASVQRALHMAHDWYFDASLGTGELYLDHAIGMARIAAVLNLDADARVAALLFGGPALAAGGMLDDSRWLQQVIANFGTGVDRKSVV